MITTNTSGVPHAPWTMTERRLRWCRAPYVVVAALLVAAGFAVPDGSHDVTGDGLVGPPTDVMSLSMVELLDDDDDDDDDEGDDDGRAGGAGRATTLTELVDDVLEGDQDRVHDGSGIDVALIDSGVAPVAGLGGKVVHGPDLSGEGAHDEAANLDTYGHGTHMAGIIAGTRAGHEGVAPGARIVSLKVAGADGETTVPQVVAAIDWVVEHHDADGFNIRIVNLSLGQDDVQDHEGDLLSAAVERAWDAGILVVVAAGNRGTEPGHLDSPAVSPFVVAVGAVDNTVDESDDEQPPTDFSSRGDGHRNPDLIAPGQSIVSYRVPGSTVDEDVPSARVGADLFKGTGTSQAAAVVSGVAARMFGEYPSMTNDEVKESLVRTARNDEHSRRAVGAGKIEGDDAIDRPRFGATQHHEPAAGDGSGIETPQGPTWSGGGWLARWAGATWSGATWSGATWSGATWSGATWSGATWSGATWSGATWSGATWSDNSWSGATWSGTGWE